MAAGDIIYRLEFVYTSDNATFPGTKLAVDAQLYVPGLMFGKFYSSHFYKQAQLLPQYKANSANPSGHLKKKVSIAGTVIGFECAVVDGIPAYLGGLDSVTADSPASDQFTLAANDDGDAPETIWHKENNLMNNEQAREYDECKCNEIDFTFKQLPTIPKVEELALVAQLQIVGSREYDMTNDNVVQNTGTPARRGTSSPASPFFLGKNNVTCTWNSKTLSNYFMGGSWGWKNDIGALLLNDGNDYPSGLAIGGRRQYKPAALKFVQVDEASDLDDIEQYVDGSTSSDLVLKITRRHASDYIQFTFKNAILESWNILPAPADDVQDPVIDALFHYTEIEVVDSLHDGSAMDPNADADYEL